MIIAFMVLQYLFLHLKFQDLGPLYIEIMKYMGFHPDIPYDLHSALLQKSPRYMTHRSATAKLDGKLGGTFAKALYGHCVGAALSA